jgi:hypothetical protein
MKKLLFALLAFPAFANAQPILDHWIMNKDGDLANYWAQTATAGAPVYTYTYTTDSTDVLKMCYNTDTVWIKANGMTDDMGRYMNPGYCLPQHYTFRLPRNPVVATTKVASPQVGSIGVLLNGIPIYGLSNSAYWNGTANVMGAGGLWHVEVGLAEGFVLDTAYGAHPQQSGAYHSHTTPYRLYNRVPNTKHAPLIGFAFDGYPVYGPYGYSNPTDTNSAITRMKTGYALRSITDRTTLPYGVTLTSAQYGPSISTTYPLGTYCEDYEWQASVGGDLDKYNGRFCKTPEYPSGTYAYFVTIDAAGNAAFPYIIGMEYYGAPDAGNFGLVPGIAIPASVTTCRYPYVTSVDEINATAGAISIFPNPTDGTFTISSNNNGYDRLTISDMTGKVVVQQQIHEQQQIQLLVPAGLYLIRISTATGGASVVKKLVVN